MVTVCSERSPPGLSGSESFALHVDRNGLAGINSCHVVHSVRRGVLGLIDGDVHSRDSGIIVLILYAIFVEVRGRCIAVVRVLTESAPARG